MNADCVTARSLLMVSILLSFFFKHSHGGNCWSSMVRNGRCTELLSDNMSREECCSAAGSTLATAWSSETLDSGALFFWRVLGGGVPCLACRQSCQGVRCGAGQRCAVKRGRPRCVCAPDCRRHRPQHKGPVCGTDGRSYRTVCRLRKRACRRKSSTLAIAYYGHCQSSCEKIRCGNGKHCLVDQNLKPHCVRCSRRCPAPTPADVTTPAAAALVAVSKQVCGADGATYPSSCHLREAACRKGKAVPVAYKGRCKPHATCSTVRCRDRQQCLTDPSSGSPRCVTCGQRCTRQDRDPNAGPLCGSNHLTYKSWCHMLQDACLTGFVIETKHSGECRSNSSMASVASVGSVPAAGSPGVSLPSSLNAVLVSDEDGFSDSS